MTKPTADLCDEFPDLVQVAVPVLQSFGGAQAFSGPIATVRALEDNTLVRQELERVVEGAVLVVDGGGSLRCALVGDRLAALAVEHGWHGVVVHGCVRDSEALASIDLGVRALHTCPRRSYKRGIGELDIPVSFAGLTFVPGHWLYADVDGLLVAPHAL